MTIMHSQYREEGTVRIDERTCTGCGHCVRFCPAEHLCMVNGRIGVNSDTPLGCIACAHCMMLCPTGSITVTGRGLSEQDLRPLPQPDSKADAESLAALMQARRSVRHFKDQEVEPALLDRVIEMASTAPMGIPPWDIGCVIVRGRGPVRSLAAEIIKGYEGLLKLFKPWALTLLRPFLGKATYETFKHFILPLARVYVTAHHEGRDMLFYRAPAVLIFHRSAYSESTDSAIACTYAMLAAESLGLGSTFIGGAPPILQRNKKLCRQLGIPEQNKASHTLILGHPAISFKQAVHRPFAHIKTIDQACR